MIPKIIHFCWGGESEMPDYAIDNVSRFRNLNPDYEIMIHDGDVVLPELREQFDAIDDWSSKSDMVRYSALKRHGGWYFDVDFFPLRPLDQASSAWGLDGSRMFVSRQRGHRAGKRLPYAACPIAATTDSPGLDHIISLHCKTSGSRRTEFGPSLIKRAVEDRPELYEVAAPGWWFPVSIDETEVSYPYMLRGMERVYLSTRETAGVRPFGAHLWAQAVDLERIYHSAPDLDLRPVAVVQDVGIEGLPGHAVAEGLEQIGYRSIVTAQPRDHMGPIRPALMVLWNGRRGIWRQTAMENGILFFVMEHGFFDRNRCSQIDRREILDRATWGRRINDPAPASGLAKLGQLGVTPRPVTPRDRGHVLILGQNAGDSQMDDSEITGAAQLVQQLGRRIPAGIRCVFRPHPLDRTPDNDLLRHWPSVRIDRPGREEYAVRRESSSLAAALEGVRFVIAINSNALVEATTLGVPCLAFGPSLGIDAGVYHRATLLSLKKDLHDMFAGWAPPFEAVERYLAHLADNQWSTDDYRDPDKMREILTRVGVALP